jgi:hypothetical protein
VGFAEWIWADEEALTIERAAFGATEMREFGFEDVQQRGPRRAK